MADKDDRILSLAEQLPMPFSRNRINNSLGLIEILSYPFFVVVTQPLLEHLGSVGQPNAIVERNLDDLKILLQLQTRDTKSFGHGIVATCPAILGQ